MSHGVGRSGNIACAQPKAVGSSTINRLASSLALHAIRLAGVSSCRVCLVLPLSTGMSLLLTLLDLRRRVANARYVIWSRIDQKSCFKAILTAGLQPLIVEPIRVDGEHLMTDLAGIEEQLQKHSSDVLCVLSTTSCFAPRSPDSIVAIGRLARRYNVFHVVNNAYGLQSLHCTRELERAGRESTVDVFVQSTDKNFGVPVGGALIAGFDEQTVNAIGESYPGRACGVMSRDLVLTLLWLGARGYGEMLAARRRLCEEMREKLDALCAAVGERRIAVPDNDISFAVTLNTVPRDMIGQFGAYLFLQHVTGARVVVAGGQMTSVCGENFVNWCAHSSLVSQCYLNVACAIGMTEKEVDVVISRLHKCFNKFAVKGTD